MITSDSSADLNSARRAREERELRLLASIIENFVVLPYHGFRCALSWTQAANLRLADTRLPRYRRLLAKSDLSLPLGRANDNLVALTFRHPGCPTMFMAANPALRETLRVCWPNQEVCFFRLDVLNVAGTRPNELAELSVAGHAPLSKRNPFNRPQLYGELPVLVAADSVRWEALGPVSREILYPADDAEPLVPSF